MAVYTEISDDDLNRFLVDYEVGELLSFKGIAEGVENTNYYVHTSAGPYILTLYEKRVAATDLPYFLGLMDHLASHGITCPTPVRNRYGQLLDEICGRPAALVSFLDGVWIRKPEAHHCASLGEALARLHLAGADFPMHRPNTLSVAGWRALAGALGPRADDITPGLADAIAEAISRQAIWPEGLPKGVIHADLFPDNVFFIGNRLSGLIDFYFACNDYFVYDVAICLNAWCFEKDATFNLTKGQALLSGYHRVRPLTDPEIAALPQLAAGAALRFLLTRSYDWLHTSPTALVTRKDPLPYLRRLRFHQAVASSREYGL